MIYNDIFKNITSWENVVSGYHNHMQDKYQRKESILYNQNTMYNLEVLQNSIINGSYSVGEYDYFIIYEPKERLIMKLPTKDRIAQHMWYNVVNEIFEQTMYEHSYACRKGKGLHIASTVLNQMIYEAIDGNKKAYAIKADIHGYFKHINHNILINDFSKIISDTNVLDLTWKFISNNGLLPNGEGIPVGNLSSQLFANIYGTKLDNFITQYLNCKYYIRYMDDFIIVSNDINYLRNCLDCIDQFLREYMLLQFNPSTKIVYANDGVDFVGFKHFGTHITPLKYSKQRLREFIIKFLEGSISPEEFFKSFNCRIGHLTHSNCYNIIHEYDANILSRINLNDIGYGDIFDSYDNGLRMSFDKTIPDNSFNGLRLYTRTT